MIRTGPFVRLVVVVVVDVDLGGGSEREREEVEVEATGGKVRSRLKRKEIVHHRRFRMRS